MYTKMVDLPMVYVIGTSNLRFIKIGKTTNFKQRFSCIKTACPFDLSLWTCIRTTDPLTIEKRLHERLNQYRLNGEWFALPDVELDWLSAYCQEQNRIMRATL